MNLRIPLQPAQGYNKIFDVGEYGMKLTRFGLLKLAKGTAYESDTGETELALVLMGGNFMHPETGRGYMESNTMCDPHASALVYRAPVEQHCSVGNDVTFRLGMTKDTVYRVFGQHKLLAATLPMVGYLAQVAF